MFNFRYRVTLFDFFSGVFKIAEIDIPGNVKKQVIKSYPGSSRHFKISPGMVSTVENSLGNFQYTGRQNS